MDEEILGWDATKGERYPGWTQMIKAEDGAAYGNGLGLRVIVSGAYYEGKKWIHVSLSRRTRMPTYDDLVMVKRAFLGPDRKAIMVLPEERNHVNIHPYCLHLWHCVDGDGLPEFSAIVPGLGRSI